jgi:Xaa-Pro aminopeptidase
VSQAATAASAERTERLAHELQERGLDALLVQSRYDLRYVTGFTGTHGLALVRARPSGQEPHVFLTDFRYETQSEQQVASSYRREIVVGELIDAAAAELGEGGGRLGFDETALTVGSHRRLRERLADQWELVGAPSIVAGLRLVKDAGEIALIRAAAVLADEALRTVLEGGLAGRTEREVAIELELRMRRLGAEAPSFPSIVAAGAHAALPHAEPRGEEIADDVLVTIDWGALLDGYCSDCTRTYATGERIPSEAREVYALVLAAQERGLEALRPGPSGREVDAAAREVIAAGGHAERFGHGLGHGVGLEVHEGPRLSRTAGEEPLREGSVVTVEPGIYVPGVLGVRIEDLAVLRTEGAEVLTGLPKELTVIG